MSTIITRDYNNLSRHVIIEKYGIRNFTRFNYKELNFAKGDTVSVVVCHDFETKRHKGFLGYYSYRGGDRHYLPNNTIGYTNVHIWGSPIFEDSGNFTDDVRKNKIIYIESARMLLLEKNYIQRIEDVEAELRVNQPMFMGGR